MFVMPRSFACFERMVLLIIPFSTKRLMVLWMVLECWFNRVASVVIEGKAGDSAL